MNTKIDQSSIDINQFHNKVNELNGYLNSIEQMDMSGIILRELNAIREIVTAYSPNQKTAVDFRSKKQQLPASAKGNNLCDIVSRISNNLKASVEPATGQLTGNASTGNDVPLKTRCFDLKASMLGSFDVYQGSQLISQWPNCKGKQLFKYLLLHRGMPTHKEVLMELFWPGLSSSSARNNLNVCICGLRQILPRSVSGFSHIVYQSDCYFLNPDLNIWVDVEMFDQAIANARSARRSNNNLAAITAYESVIDLYQGELLAEDRYDDWVQPIRQKYRDSYLDSLSFLRDCYLDKNEIRSAITTCLKIVATEPLDEESLGSLMRCYSKVGKRHLAIRAYHEYTQRLSDELDLTPGSELQKLLFKIKKGDLVEIKSYPDNACA